MRDLGRLIREYARLERARTETGLTLQEVRRWRALKQQLDRHFSPGASPSTRNQRASVRVPTRLQVSFESFGTFQDSIMTNLSRGGMFVSTGMPLEIGDQVQLRIRIEDEDTELEVPCRVVSTSVGRGFDTQRMGMGLAFEQMDASLRTRLDDLYERALRAHAKDEPGAAPRRRSA